MLDFDLLDALEAELIRKGPTATLENAEKVHACSSCSLLQITETPVVKEEETVCCTNEPAVLDYNAEKDVVSPVCPVGVDIDMPSVASRAQVMVPSQVASAEHQGDVVVAQKRHMLFPLSDTKNGEQPLDGIETGVWILLRPIREQQTANVLEKLRLYDLQRRYPRLEDVRHQHRDGYENFLRGEAILQIRDVYGRSNFRAREGQLWEIGGGADKGGLVVRKGRELISEEFRERLSTGSFVEEIEVCGERLHYKLVAGTGPPSGWITSRIIVGGDTVAKHLATRVGCNSAVVMGSDKRPAHKLIIISLMAVHIGNIDRLCRFQHVLQSIAEQKVERHHAEFVTAFSWSATTPELESRVRKTINDFMHTQGPNMVTVAAEHRERQSQFQHIKAALVAAEHGIRTHLVQDGTVPSCWVIFGDDDDLWHPARVSTYVNAIRAHTRLDGVAVFATTQRVNCRENMKIDHHEMPTKHHHVDMFILSGRGKRLDKQDASRTWFSMLKNAGAAVAATLPAPDELGMEYFHLCPRLRIVHEFFEVTAPDIIQHRYCDLRFCSFLLEYPRKGREMGLEVSWFESQCWMYFYACAGGEAGSWHATLDNPDDELNDFPPDTIGTEGHMALEVHVERAEIEVANKTHLDFKAYQHDITVSRLTKYWAGVRNYMELALVPRHKATLDQRVFDGFVWGAVNTSFGSFAEIVIKMEAAKSQRAARMMYKQGQLFAKTMARKFGVDIFWHCPGQFLEPVVEDTYVDPAYAAPLVGNWASTSTPKGYYQHPTVPKYAPTNGHAAHKPYSAKGKGKSAGHFAQNGFWNKNSAHGGFAHSFATKGAFKGYGKSWY